MSISNFALYIRYGAKIEILIFYLSRFILEINYESMTSYTPNYKKFKLKTYFPQIYLLQVIV